MLSATYEVIAWNELAAALMEDFSALSRRDRNLIRRCFLGPFSDAGDFGAAATNDLRAAAARYPNDPDVTGLVAELVAGSEEFAALWNRHCVISRPALRKTFEHPLVGTVAVNCDVLDITDLDQRVVIYTAEPGSRSEEALRLLSVLGTQRMDVPG